MKERYILLKDAATPQSISALRKSFQSSVLSAIYDGWVPVEGFTEEQVRESLKEAYEASFMIVSEASILPVDMLITDRLVSRVMSLMKRMKEEHGEA